VPTRYVLENHHKEPNQIGNENLAPVDHSTSELIFPSIETAPDMSHISLEYLSAYSFRWFIVAENTVRWFVVRKKNTAGWLLIRLNSSNEQGVCRFPAEKYSGVPGWTRRNNLVQLKQQ
jgi:hypothetical protein